MYLSKQKVLEFQELIKQLFQRDITTDEAYAEGSQLVLLMELILKQIEKGIQDETEQRRTKI